METLIENVVDLAHKKAEIKTIQNQKTAHLLPLELKGEEQGPELRDSERLLDPSIWDLTETVDGLELPRLVAFNLSSTNPAVTIEAEGVSQCGWGGSNTRIESSQVFETTPISQKTVDSLCVFVEKRSNQCAVDARTRSISNPFPDKEARTNTYRVNAKCSVAFNGFLPDEIRAVAKKAIADPRYQDVSVLCDVTGTWDVKIDEKIAPTPLRNPDPLIIARIGASKFWVVLAKFDLVGLEKVVDNEYVGV